MIDRVFGMLDDLFQIYNDQKDYTKRYNILLWLLNTTNGKLGYYLFTNDDKTQLFAHGVGGVGVTGGTREGVFLSATGFSVFSTGKSKE